jgi:hypothetical protein
VAQWNKTHAAAHFAAGTTVVVFVPARASKATPTRKTAAAKAGTRAGRSVKVVEARSSATRRR